MQLRDRLRYAGMSLKSLLKPAILEYFARHVANLERDNSGLKTQNEEISARAAERSAQIAGLKAHLQEAARQAGTLEEYNTALKSDNAELKAIVSQLIFEDGALIGPRSSEPAEVDGLDRKSVV